MIDLFPIATDPAVPENTMFFMPTEIKEAIDHASQMYAKAGLVVLNLLFIPLILGPPGLLLLPELNRRATNQIMAAEAAMYGTELLIAAAALENRISCIRGIDWGSTPARVEEL